MTQYKIGISVGRSIDSSILFKTGVPQNIAILFELLQQLGHEVTLLTETPPISNTASLSKNKTYPIKSVKEALDPIGLDIALEMGMVFTPNTRSLISATGCKIISVRCGNSLIIDMEDLFTKSSQPDGYQHVKKDLDHIWILPHHIHQKTYLESLLDTEASIMPYIWEPIFLEPDLFNENYSRKVPNIYIMEPNISVLKNALIPLAILNNQYSYAPESFNQGFIVNGQNLQTNPYFLNNIVANFDVLNAKMSKDKVFFTPRCKLQEALTQPDILLSHQWLNGLNYLSLEALYLGVGLVHNSSYLKEVGYFYPGFDAHLGQLALNDALQNHAANFSSHLAKNRQFIKKYSIFDTTVQNEYSKLLEQAINS
jgi:hypothetical protein